MAAMVACVQLRAVFVREMRGDGGRACGRKAGGARPDRSVSRHAVRSAASSCQRAVSIWNMPMEESQSEIQDLRRQLSEASGRDQALQGVIARHMRGSA